MLWKASNRSNQTNSGHMKHHRMVSTSTTWTHQQTLIGNQFRVYLVKQEEQTHWQLTLKCKITKIVLVTSLKYTLVTQNILYLIFISYNHFCLKDLALMVSKKKPMLKFVSNKETCQLSLTFSIGKLEEVSKAVTQVPTMSYKVMTDALSDN